MGLVLKRLSDSSFIEPPQIRQRTVTSYSYVTPTSSDILCAGEGKREGEQEFGTSPFLSRSLQLPPEAWLRMSIGNCGITKISIRPNGRVSLREMGGTGHLPPELITFN